jgi:hypothetical protein
MEQTWNERWAWLNRAGVPGLPGFPSADAALEDMRRKLSSPAATLAEIETIGFRLCVMNVTATVTRILSACEPDPAGSGT